LDTSKDDVQNRITQLNQQANQLYQSGQYEEAIPVFLELCDTRKKILGEDHPDYGSSLYTLALLYYNMGDYSKAAPLLQKALEITKKALGENHPDYAGRLNNLAALYVATQRYAFLLLHESASVQDRIIDQIFSIASERQRMLFLMSINIDFYLFMSLVIQRFSKSILEVQAALDLIMRRKSIGAETLSIQREAVLSGKYPELKPQIVELNHARMQIASMILSGPKMGESPDRYKQDLEGLISKKEKTETALANNIPEVKLELNLKAANCITLSNILSEGEVLVELVRFYNAKFNAILAYDDLQWNPPRYVAFVLRSKEPNSIQMIDLGDAEYIDRMIVNFRLSVSEHDVDRRNQRGDSRHLIALNSDKGSHSQGYAPGWKDIGYELYKSVFEPLLPAIGDSKRLFIAPEGDLTRLPFEVQPTPSV
jgi:tetratricopeptide (TPR) repeat protein